jgi:hypothetical protein
MGAGRNGDAQPAVTLDALARGRLSGDSNGSTSARILVAITPMVAGNLSPVSIRTVDDSCVPIALCLPFGLAATGRRRLPIWTDTFVPHAAFAWRGQILGGNALTATVMLCLGWCGHKCGENDGSGYLSHVDPL